MRLSSLFSLPLAIAAVALLFFWEATGIPRALPPVNPSEAKMRIAIIGLDHDHVWGLLKDIAGEPDAELIAIADVHPQLVSKAKQ